MAKAKAETVEAVVETEETSVKATKAPKGKRYWTSQILMATSISMLKTTAHPWRSWEASSTTWLAATEKFWMRSRSSHA